MTQNREHLVLVGGLVLIVDAIWHFVVSLVNMIHDVPVIFANQAGIGQEINAVEMFFASTGLIGVRYLIREVRVACMLKQCIICGNCAGSREHLFPAALGGRRICNSIYCNIHNQGFPPLVSTPDTDARHPQHLA